MTSRHNIPLVHNIHWSGQMYFQSQKKDVQEKYDSNLVRSTTNISV